MYSILWLSEILFLFINYQYPFFENFTQVSHNFKIINGQNISSGENHES